MKTTSPRRREVRRNVPRETSLWARLRQRREIFWAVIYGLVLTLAGSLLAWAGQARPRFVEGEVTPSAIVPRVEFNAIDELRTEQERQDAFEREPARYLPRQAYLDKVRANINALLRLGASEVETLDQVAASTREAFQLDMAALRQLQRINQDPALQAEWQQDVDLFMDMLMSIALLDPERAAIEKDPRDRAPTIRIYHPNAQWLPPREDTLVYSTAADQEAVRLLLRDFANRYFVPDLVNSVVAAAMQDPQPFYEYSDDLTKQVRQKAREAQPVVTRSYHPAEPIVPANHRLTRTDLEIIRAEERAYQEQLTSLERGLTAAGRIGLVVLVATALWVYIVAYNRRVAANPLRGLALTLLFIGGEALAVTTSVQMPNWLYGTATLPTLLVTMVMAIAYDQRFALAIGSLHGLLVMLALDLPPAVLVVLLMGVSVAIVQLPEIRTHSKLVLTGVWTGLAMALATVFVALGTRNLMTDEELVRILRDTAFAFWAGVVTGVVANAILPAIQKLFRVTTAITLKELNDPSQPLLRRLGHEAPGTWQHSLRLADMAEAAAEAIGADALACKVGAMYHDIGKVNKPSYFVENQGGGPNRHAKLSPAMSLLIIVGHVKDGIEMAREYHLPPVIRHFIESHHGTTLVEYFYHAAKQQRDAENEPAPREFEFRYPGPKPQTKEAAILMLCDGLEGAARALPEPTPVRLEQLVHMLAEKRLTDGQFDECNLTLAELHKIEQAITKTLCAIYHGRIKYPGDRLPEPAKTAPAAGGSVAGVKVPGSMAAGGAAPSAQAAAEAAG